MSKFYILYFKQSKALVLCLKTTITSFAHPPGKPKDTQGFFVVPLNNGVPSDENALKRKNNDDRKIRKFTSEGTFKKKKPTVYFK